MIQIIFDYLLLCSWVGDAVFEPLEMETQNLRAMKCVKRLQVRRHEPRNRYGKTYGIVLGSILIRLFRWVQ